MRKFLLITFAVLLVSQLTFAQAVPDKSTALQSLAKAQTTGKAQPLIPKALTGMKLRPTIWVTGHKYDAKNGPLPKVAPGEPWFCDFNTGYQVAVCPKGLQTAYGTNFPGANGGAGMTIAIVDFFAYPSAEANFAQFNHDMHLPACTTANGCFTSIDFSGGLDGTGSGWDLESMLDIEYAHAMAPNAKILYIQADPYGDGSYEEGYAQSNANVVSNSWTFNAGEGASYFEAYLGIGPPTLFASGDSSAWPYYSVVGYPCTSPKANCIGGTSLYLKPNLTRLKEDGWAGGGGGCSGVFGMPSFQGNNNSNVCSPYRAAPDFAAIADTNTPVAVYICNWAWGCYYYGVGGTSVATPVLSGLVADLDTARVSFGKGKLTYLMNNELYPAANYNYNYYFYDVVNGYNGFYAGPQYDLVTGLGVPNGKAIGSRFFGIP